MNELTAELIQATNDNGVSSKNLSEKLGVDADVILKSVEEMERLTYQMFFIKYYKKNGDASNIMMADGYYTVKIPETEKWSAELLLEEGGWSKKFDVHFEKLKSQQQEEIRRRKLEEENWTATREQAEKANRHSRIANTIATISAIIALAAILLQLLGEKI